VGEGGSATGGEKGEEKPFEEEFIQLIQQNKDSSGTVRCCKKKNLSTASLRGKDRRALEVEIAAMSKSLGRAYEA